MSRLHRSLYCCDRFLAWLKRGWLVRERRSMRAAMDRASDRPRRIDRFHVVTARGHTVMHLDPHDCAAETNATIPIMNHAAAMVELVEAYERLRSWRDGDERTGAELDLVLDGITMARARPRQTKGRTTADGTETARLRKLIEKPERRTFWCRE